jgi:hypothetical protein
MSKEQKQTPLLTGLSKEEISKELHASMPVFTSHLGMLAKANTIEDVISALKNDIVRYWVNYNYLATADFLLSVTRMILIHLRAKSDKAYPRIPPISDGWLGIKDWITDVKSKPPEKLIPTSVAVDNFQVCSRTLLREIAKPNGKIKSYRPADSPKNSSHLFDPNELHRAYGLKKSASSPVF